MIMFRVDFRVNDWQTNAEELIYLLNEIVEALKIQITNFIEIKSIRIKEVE